MRKQTNTLSPSPKGFQSPTLTSEKSADSDSDVRKALPTDIVAFCFGISDNTGG
jgi:hypothetical protein